MSDYVWNFIVGICSGATATLVSHPFQTIKNKLQIGEKVTNYQYRDIKWLYSGLTRAMVGYSLEKMLVFGVFKSLRQHDVDPFTAGGISGLVASLSITPAEQLIIDKQLKVNSFKLQHLYKGFLATAFRESLGFAVHFTIYTNLMNRYNKEKNIPKTALFTIFSIIGGWGTITPIDRLKTQIQSGTFNYKTYDFMESFSGFRFVLLRAIPFHITSFCVMEYLSEMKEEYNIIFD